MFEGFVILFVKIFEREIYNKETMQEKKQEGEIVPRRKGSKNLTEINFDAHVIIESVLHKGLSKELSFSLQQGLVAVGLDGFT